MPKQRFNHMRRRVECVVISFSLRSLISVWPTPTHTFRIRTLIVSVTCVRAVSATAVIVFHFEPYLLHSVERERVSYVEIILVLTLIFCCCWCFVGFTFLRAATLTALLCLVHSLFAMAHSTWHIRSSSSSLAIIGFLLAILISLDSIGDVSAQIEAQPWYESLPAVAMDYKIHLDAGKEDCYYQYVQPGATLYVSFQASLSLFWFGLMRSMHLSRWR